MASTTPDLWLISQPQGITAPWPVLNSNAQCNRALDLQHKTLQVQVPAVAFSGNNLEQVVHTRASVTKQYNLILIMAHFTITLALQTPVQIIYCNLSHITCIKN